MRKNIIFITVSFLILLGGLSFSQSGELSFKLPEYETHILENGITLYLMEQHEVPLIYVSAIFPAGAVWDENQNGLAAFTAEALLFGSKNFTKQQIEETFDFLGAKIWIGSGLESSMVNISFKKDDIDKVLPIFTDVISNPTFPQNEFDKRKQRWLAELDQAKESPRSVIRSYFNKFLFGNNPYGNPVYGSRKTIETLTREDLNEFFNTYYDYSQAGIAVVGDFSTGDMKDKISSLLSSLTATEKINSTEYQDENIIPLNKSRVLLVDKNDSRETTFLIGGIGFPWSNKELTQIEVINTILGGRFTSWLNDELRVNAGLTYSAGSRFRSFKKSGTFYISSFTATETTIEAIDLALEVLNRLHTKGVDEQTLSSAKNYVKGQFPPDYETSGELADLLVTMHFYGLDDSYINNFEKNVDDLTVEKAKDIVAKYFPKENLQFVLIGKADEIRDKVKKYGVLTEKSIEEDAY